METLLGRAMLFGMLAGGIIGATQSGANEDALKEKIGEIEAKTVKMNNQMQILSQASGKIRGAALQEVITNATAIAEIKKSSNREIRNYLKNEKMIAIYGIVFVMSVVLYLLAKLLLPTWNNIKNL